MKIMDKVERKFDEMFEKVYNDFETVKLLESLLDEEHSNAEVISSLLDRIEELEEKVESLMGKEEADKNENRS